MKAWVTLLGGLGQARGGGAQGEKKRKKGRGSRMMGQAARRDARSDLPRSVRGLDVSAEGKGEGEERHRRRRSQRDFACRSLSSS